MTTTAAHLADEIRATTTSRKYQVAFRVPGGTWKRRTITEGTTAEDGFYAMVEDEGAEVRWQDEA